MTKPFMTNIFIKIRNLIFPVNLILDIVPTTGKILDIGCGHGTLSFYIAKTSFKRKVLGIDPSKSKISSAKNTYNRNNLNYESTFLQNIKQKFDCIIISDVLYLMPTSEKIKTLKKIKKILKNNGILIIKETLPNPFIKLEELIMTKYLKATYSDFSKTYIEDKNTYVNIIIKNKFYIRKIIQKRKFVIYNHIIFIVENNN